MIEYEKPAPVRSWVRERVFLGLDPAEYLKRLITPFNLVAGIIVLLGLILLVIRYSQGLGAVTSGSQDQPWGLLLGWGLFSGVPLSATGFLMGTAVHILNLKEYRPVVHNAILIGFLGYFFAVVFLLVDLGRPWRLPYPMFFAFGPASVLFLVAWHVALYLSVQFLEFSPALFEWLNVKTPRRWALNITIGVTIFGVILSTLHQSALGALFLLAPGKLHPLWHTPYIPALFFVSAIAAGLSMVIFVSWLTKLLFKNRTDREYRSSLDNITIGLGKAVSLVLFTYFGMKVIAIAHSNAWGLIGTSYGHLFLADVLGLVLLPSFLLFYAVQKRLVGLVRFSAVLTIAGVVLNRLTVSLFALNWRLPHREFFNLREFIIVLSIVTTGLLVYRWIINRMPVLSEHPKPDDDR